MTPSSPSSGYTLDYATPTGFVPRAGRHRPGDRDAARSSAWSANPDRARRRSPGRSCATCRECRRAQRRHQPGRPGSATTASRGRDRRDPRPAHRHGVPGPSHLAQPDPDARRADRRGAGAPSRPDAHGRPGREGEAMLARVGLKQPAAMMRRYPHEASGGEKQRVVIATAFACQPECILFDEPTTALDVITARQILDLFAELQAETAVASLYISHDLALVSRVADRVAVIHRGRIVEHGEVDEVFDAPRDDYTRRLLAAVPRPDHRLVTGKPAAGAEPLVEVERLSVRYGRTSFLSALLGRAPTQVAGASRGQPLRPARRDPGHRGRIGFGQVDAGARPDRPQPLRGRGALRRPAHRRPPRHGPRLPPRRADRLPASRLFAQSAPARARDPVATAEALRPAKASPHAIARPAGAGAPARDLRRALPAPALRRREAARRHRSRLRRRRRSW